ncbi:hypothetical protein pEaSNUABM40_00144 [Erwinia phage pEa_SNUABM_40]|uniref:Uncharacterized protein n=1 Tax=Erwinia phage pEa_SNUABM_3 TaxID=2869552 RepID=A0AAE7XIX4_9CAUD|nr:ATPase [Erwinia phage pEa_SNUABM_3]QZE56679.1 hypothetical protein pEaSNUABM20_00143 [Erwinia phage pEa_SNUABM_20]QZE58360.1 hypothetical protein pEaSNUABM40_00144 [Erwinia phage pEa_SNUABM_40]UAW52924.1 hypothetical protein pEaSNUABM23_00142 [Erwinia phage pEa_SNUABM_23]UIW10820.1 hypothetical protein pEaSNUABM23_00142 [Erwinia phage pEa_SNUABM_31]QZE56340.1 hypothetical protein pEaSNUABM3_00143 [Erwinia phage pEa_SNUABM_3]
MPKITQLAGILCVGKNHNQAVENFRRTALGQNLMIFGSSDGVGFASQSGADLYNPKGGNELLEEHPDLVERAEVQSQSSAGDVKAHYTICLDGCGSHVISDSSALVQGCCPSCSADLSEITDERVTQFLAESAAADEQVEHAGLVATGATAEEAQRNFAQALSNAHAFTAVSSTGSFNAAVAANFDPYTGQAVDSCEPQESPEAVTALSSAATNGEVEAHMYSCSAKCDQPFTVSSDEEPVFCAHCSAALVDEPVEASTSGDDSDIDIVEEDDLEDMDDDEEDDDFDSESSNDDEDDDIDDEEDLDDEDLDEDDLDDEDMEDLEDDEFDSESSSDDEEDEEDDLEEDDLDDEDLEEDDLEEDDFDSESSSDDDEDLDDEDDLEEDDLDLDDEEDEFDSESKVVNRVFNSLSTAQAQHGTLDPSLVSLSRSTGKVAAVHMYYDGQPIARATFASVSGAVGEENAAKSFESDNFIRAVSHSLNQTGVTGTCEAFGFMPYQIEMPVDKLLVAESDTRISEATANVTATIEEATAAHSERFVAALSAAQLGITKNFWGDASNPIVDSLSRSLTAAGIKDPRALIEQAFIAHGKDFLTVALSKANDLMSKSEVAQNEISESIDAAAGTVTAARANVVQQAPAVAPKAQPSAAQLLSQEEETVESQSSASTDSSFEDKLARLRCK